MDMEEMCSILADRVQDSYDAVPNINGSNTKHRRVLVAMAGGPGSGKSSIAAGIAKAVDSRGIKTQCVELEGFMKPQSELAKMKDPQDAKDRRGAIWTFDVWAPYFDLKEKDPVPQGQEISKDAQCLIIEGIYVLANEHPWSQIGDLVDQKWFVHVEPQLQRDRVAGREVDKGIEKDMESAYRRYDTHDGLNNKYIVVNSLGVDVVIENSEEKNLKEMNGAHPTYERALLRNANRKFAVA